jgi:hypothetical protein
MINQKKLIILAILSYFIIPFVNADIISINSGGNEQIIVNTNEWIEGFFFGVQETIEALYSYPLVFVFTPLCSAAILFFLYWAMDDDKVVLKLLFFICGLIFIIIAGASVISLGEIAQETGEYASISEIAFGGQVVSIWLNITTIAIILVYYFKSLLGDFYKVVNNKGFSI